jgi:hypothetical protein
MRRVALLLMLAVPSVVPAQAKKPIAARAPAGLRIPDPPNPPLMFPSTRVEYDEFDRTTTVALGDRWLVGQLALNGRFVYLGKTPRVPPLVLFTLRSQSEEWEYLRCHFVDMLADGTPVRLGKPEHDGHVGNGYVIEFVNFTVAPTQLFRMAAAKQVRGRICNVEFTLSDEDRLALQEFASRMKAPSP